MQLQLGLSSLNWRHSSSDSIHFLFAYGLGHARLRHFFLDAGATVATIRDRNRHAWVVRPGPRAPAKAKAQTRTEEMGRTWPARIAYR
jgi:hypothetical protein